MEGSGVGTREAENVCHKGTYTLSGPHPVPMGRQSPGRVGREVSPSSGSMKSCSLRARLAPTLLQAPAEGNGSLLAWGGEGSSSHLLVLIAVLWGWRW